MTPIWTITPASQPTVIDLSHNNPGFGTLAEFQALRTAGITEVIHKASQGDGFTDPLYAVRRPLAPVAGLRWSAYHFCTSDPVEAQLAHFMAAVGNHEGIHRVALDAELNRGATIVPSEAAAFAEALDGEWGAQCLRYGNASVLEYRLPGWHDGPLWWAKYGPEPTVELMASLGLDPARVVLWQATSTGRLPGYLAGVGDVDLSYERPAS